MSQYSRVAWKDGMFLLPQHFQQADRSVEAALQLALRAHAQLAWGVLDLKHDEQALAEGRFELIGCRAILPDGLAVDIPGADTPPPPLPLRLAAGAKAVEVFLAIPARRARVPLVTASASRADIRYVEQVIEVSDDNEPDRSQPIEVAVKNLRLAQSAAEMEGMVTLKLAEVVRTAEGQWQLRNGYVPPCVYVTAAPYLVGLVRELLIRATSKADELTQQRRQRGTDTLEFNAADLLSFWFLHALNQHLPAIRHLLFTPGTHPARLFEELLRLMGALLVFALGAASDCPTYQHDDIGGCYTQVVQRLYELLGFLMREKYTFIALQQNRNVWDGRIDDSSLLERGDFYLVATGALPRAEFERLPSACKIADGNRVENLARTNNPGLQLEPVPRPPPPIPVRGDAFYFRLLREGPLWQEICRSGQLGIFVMGAPKGLTLELVALRDR